MAFKKIAVMGDSLALPRPADHLVIEQTYPTLLAMEPDFLVFNKSRPNADTDLLYRSRAG